MTRTIEQAKADFPPMEGDALATRIRDMRDNAKSLGGIEVAYPDWPEADAAVDAYPTELSLGGARGPGGEWRRLEWIGD